LSFVGQGDGELKDTTTSKPADTADTLQPCNEYTQQDDDAQDDDDGVITFKDQNAVYSMAGTLSKNQIEEHCLITGLLEEPTLQMDFADQSTVLVESDEVNGIPSHEGEGEVLNQSNDSTSSQLENRDQSLCVAKQQARNLSTICEESDIDCNKGAGHRTPFAGKLHVDNPANQ
jgi:hypothetical protein